MRKKLIKNTPQGCFTDSTFELVKWSTSSSQSINNNIFAIQTTRNSPFQNSLPSNKLSNIVPSGDSSSSQFGGFNLGNHVGDNPKKVKYNRDQLTGYINQQFSIGGGNESTNSVGSVKIQWLEQVHGNDVTIVDTVVDRPIIADASITRHKYIALAIMTADCLPILLTDIEGKVIAAIHGGWRSLAANIIERTVLKMDTSPSDIVVWLGPCISAKSFEVGGEVKQAFIEQDLELESAFIIQPNGKYLANLHTIARLQLLSLGIHIISSLAECTYQQTDKYYSFRKDEATGRMASIICLR